MFKRGKQRAESRASLDTRDLGVSCFCSGSCYDYQEFGNQRADFPSLICTEAKLFVVQEGERRGYNEILLEGICTSSKRERRAEAAGLESEPRQCSGAACGQDYSSQKDTRES